MELGAQGVKHSGFLKYKYCRPELPCATSIEPENSTCLEYPSSFSFHLHSLKCFLSICKSAQVYVN